jgi:hypothetical protein
MPWPSPLACRDQLHLVRHDCTRAARQLSRRKRSFWRLFDRVCMVVVMAEVDCLHLDSCHYCVGACEPRSARELGSRDGSCRWPEVFLEAGRLGEDRISTAPVPWAACMRNVIAASVAAATIRPAQRTDFVVSASNPGVVGLKAERVQTQQPAPAGDHVRGPRPAPASM